MHLSFLFSGTDETQTHIFHLGERAGRLLSLLVGEVDQGQVQPHPRAALLVLLHEEDSQNGDNDDYFESVKITPYPAISLKEGAVSLKYLHDMKNRRDVTLDFRRFDATPLLDAFEKAIRILDNNLLA